ncbi:hypothetical protein [Spirosoma endbachense]|uniref:Uncharacterized protein n=1 Tax=Spirosoma endbachense TaxID=2666025 RepID=A0A6P1VZ95_9BACT|nr:hypothetical protein [Spirosoma endbachense]QHV98511.1 hypothetical protein GJR95_27460 [Spirosoma endbachense]
MQKTETQDGITITAYLHDDGRVMLDKPMQVRFELPDGGVYNEELYPESADGLNYGGLSSQFTFVKAIRSIKSAL